MWWSPPALPPSLPPSLPSPPLPRPVLLHDLPRAKKCDSEEEGRKRRMKRPTEEEEEENHENDEEEEGKKRTRIGRREKADEYVSEDDAKIRLHTTSKKQPIRIILTIGKTKKHKEVTARLKIKTKRLKKKFDSKYQLTRKIVPALSMM